MQGEEAGEPPAEGTLAEREHFETLVRNFGQKLSLVTPFSGNRSSWASGKEHRTDAIVVPSETKIHHYDHVKLKLFNSSEVQSHLSAGGT